jgi:hypothetical protein
MNTVVLYLPLMHFPQSSPSSIVMSLSDYGYSLFGRICCFHLQNMEAADSSETLVQNYTTEYLDTVPGTSDPDTFLDRQALIHKRCEPTIRLIRGCLSCQAK